jgi:UDP-N-acetylglucosamine 2-epimerase (non-hydrolysing)
VRRRIVAVVGARPNFMKMAPVVRALEGRPDLFEAVVVHTGQHYDAALSRVFLDELGLGDPNVYLGIGSGSHAQQIARVVERLEPVLAELEPELVLVAGDVNSTLGAALAASTLRLPLGHVEAGLRSFDPTMPEETNRRLTDALSQLLFIHSPEARDNLLREGCATSAIHAVGNTMIDTLVAMRARIAAERAAERHGLTAGEYLVVTLHRPALVDGPLLELAVARLEALSEELDVVLPLHPRTRQSLDALGPRPRPPGLRLLEPLPYVEFLSLVADARGVLTDSGGIQEETTYLGVPCFTLRDNTERPITVELGTNVLLGLDPDRIAAIPGLLSAAPTRGSAVPPLWDGGAAERIVDVLAEASAREAVPAVLSL